MELTPRQTEILELIRAHIADTGYPPTRAEICQTMGFKSPNAAEDHLRALARKGAIEVLSGTSRGIRILLPDEPEGLPVVGRIKPGSTLLAEENIEGHYCIDPGRFRPKPHYLLRMQDGSMQDAGIAAADLLLIHRTKKFQNEQIVAIRLDGEVLVRRIYQHGRWKHRIRLESGSADFESFDIDRRKQTLVVEGRTVGLIRSL